MKLYEAVRKHEFAEGICFLCGRRIPADIRSQEHVFPKWLLHRFELWNVKLTLLNGTKIPYRQLVVPCCKACNNRHLSRLEAEIESAFARGVSAVRKLDRKKLMIWVMKIFFGLVYRELFLPFDRRNTALGGIVTAEDMEQFQMVHFILQACRFPMRFTQFDSDIPASLFVFRLKEPKNPKLKFDYKDDVLHRTLYLRIGNVGILAAFDAGAQNVEGRHFFPKFQRYALHPLQFAELGANLFLKAKKFLRNPKVIIGELPKEIHFTVAPIAGLSNAPVFEMATRDELADLLVEFLHYPRDQIMPDPGRLMTWLYDDNGGFANISVRRQPWSGYPSKSRGLRKVQNAK
jgi:hypothetical protein